MGKFPLEELNTGHEEGETMLSETSKHFDIGVLAQTPRARLIGSILMERRRSPFSNLM